MKAPVSVVIPCYRCVTTIERAVRCVILQTMIPREIILVEDASDDEGKTLSALDTLRAKYDEKETSLKIIVLEKNQGPAGARNAGWNTAREPYIAFLDADDAWNPRKIEIQYMWMKQHPDAVLSGHGSVCLRPDQPWPELPRVPESKLIGGGELLFSNKMATRSAMIRRDIPYRFEIEKNRCEDYHLWLRIVLHGHPTWFINAPLCYSYNLDFLGNGLSSDLWGMEKGELDTYRRLYGENLISFWSLLFLGFVSLSKYIRRVIVRLIMTGHE
jgi:glycosyltransferase involved in cell wall biosynthesis